MHMSRYTSCLLIFILMFGIHLQAKTTKTTEQNNKFGGKTIFTDYQSGIRYTNEENLKYKTEYFDGSEVLRVTEALLQDGSLYRTYHDAEGVIQTKEWEGPDKVIDSKEYYRDGKLDHIAWYSSPEVVESISYFDEKGVMTRIERFPADSPTQIEYYRSDQSIDAVDVFNEDSLRTEKVFFDPKGKEIRREFYTREGSLHRVTEYDKKGRLSLNEYYSRTGRKTIEHFDGNVLIKKEVFDRSGNLDKISHFNDDGDMTSAEIYDREGKLSSIRHYDENKNKIKEEDIRSDGSKTIQYFKDKKPTKKEYYSPSGSLLKTEEF